MVIEKQIKKAYFDWLYDILCWDQSKSYIELLHALDEITFVFDIEMDGNRAADGEDLRYRFGHENNYEDVEVATFLDNRPCSVLEMMAGLAIRFEEHIMRDPDYGDRTSMWFWDMITNLGLDDMSDDCFNPAKVKNIVDRFLNREYAPDGTGGPFTIKGCPTDLRQVELWFQGNWYLNTIT